MDIFNEIMASQSSIASCVKDRLPQHCYLNLEDDDERTLELIKEVESSYFSKGDVRATNLPDSDASSDEETDFMTWSDSDIALNVDFKYFEQNGCGCKHLYGRPCCEVIGFETIKSTRLSISELSKDGLDLVVLAHLNQSRNSSSYVNRSGSPSKSKGMKTKGRQRSTMNYFLGGREICKATYMVSYGLSIKRLKNLCRHFDEHGILPREHGNKGKNMSKVKTVVNDEHVITFIRSYADINGLQLPGKMPKLKSDTIMMLPSDKSKSGIWREYVKCCTESGISAVGLSKFKSLWKRYLPDIALVRISTDLCDTCQTNNHQIIKSANLNEAEKSDRLRQQKSHLQVASECRKYYKQQCESVIAYWSLLSETGMMRELDGPIHISFGFGQDLSYPYSPQQVGPMYFKTPRKCSMFGVCTEHNPKQVNYLIDEADLTGKGSNETISYLHHYLMCHINKTKSLQFHGDDCTQNKNDYLMQYMCWRVLSGQNESIEASFMMANHTRFGPEWCFGLIKLKYRRSYVSSMLNIAEVIQSSTTKNINQPQMIRDPTTQDIVVNSYNWKMFFNDLFHGIPNLNKYHHFRFSCECPGYVFVREFPSSPEVCVKMLRDGKLVPHRHSMPAIIHPPRLTPERAWYLYDKVRRHCGKQYVDISFPKPDMPRPSNPEPPPMPAIPEFNRPSQLMPSIPDLNHSANQMPDFKRPCYDSTNGENKKQKMSDPIPAPISAHY